MAMLSTARGRSSLTVSTVFTCLATLLVLVRVYTRSFVVKKMGSDDYTIVVSLAFSWMFFGAFVGEVYHGMGAHYTSLTPGAFKAQMIFFWLSVPLYQSSLIIAKMSILLQYRRIFSTTRMGLACNLLIAFLALYGTWTIISAWVNCIPLEKFWDPSVPGFCFDKKALWFSNSAIHILTDLLIFIYPMPVLRSLQLPKRQKFALMGIFALGGFVMITSILRLQSLLVISNSSDPTYDNPGAASWSAVECNVAIICACLPSIRAFISSFHPHIFSTPNNGYRSRTGRPWRMEPGGGQHTNNHTKVTVSGDRSTERSYDVDLSSSGSMRSHTKGVWEKEGFAGIKVTTFVTQESTVCLPELDSLRHDTASTPDARNEHLF